MSTVRLDYLETRNEREDDQRLLKQRLVKLGAGKRAAVLAAIKETCEIRKWELWVTDVRTNHVHTRVSALCKSEPILNALKANATRKMKESGCWFSERSPWVRGSSKRYLWTEDLLRAIRKQQLKLAYVAVVAVEGGEGVGSLFQHLLGHGD